VIGRITPAGQVAAFPIPSGRSLPLGIAAGVDGNIWFGEQLSPHVGRVNISYTDLAVSVTASPSAAVSGKPLTYTVTVTNQGSIDATNVIVTDALPLGALFVVSLSATQGTVRQSPRIEGTTLINSVIATIGTLHPSASATVTIVVNMPAAPSISNPVVVHADESDPVPDNDSATVVTTISISSNQPSGGGTNSSAATYLGKQRLYSGKGAKRKLTGFQLNFSAPLDLASASSRTHYQLSQTGRTKRAVAKAIPLKLIRASADGLTVSLTPGKYDAKKPLRLTITGLRAASGHAIATMLVTL
jgi:uncharacterized repeat protein (TIGR01451 family)